MNAFQAVPNGGTRSIATLSTDEHVIVTVEDTGIHIPEKSMFKIFDPFFTTKAQGQGLGLSICKKFVEANGGSIEVKSEEGKGTIFKVKLLYDITSLFDSSFCGKQLFRLLLNMFYHFISPA